MNENMSIPVGEKPGLVKVISIMTLISGIISVLWGIGVTFAVVFGSFLFGLICVPITLLPTVLGIFEIIYAAKLLYTPPQPVMPSKTIAILEIISVLTGNAIALIIGILSLVFYEDPVVKAYFARLNANNEA